MNSMSRVQNGLYTRVLLKTSPDPESRPFGTNLPREIKEC